MDLNQVSKLAEELAGKYNPEGLSPFPYENIQADKKDLDIYLVELDQSVSGAIGYNKDNKQFEIFINNLKSNTRQHFTIAHELGHYFLHPDEIKKLDVLIDGEQSFDRGSSMLFRLDQATPSQLEIEANNFAASLIMPEELVKKAWKSLKSIQESAKVFQVSPSAMSIRLERLKLLS